jgi:large exoprotein involved in heme utilization and adhesion
VSAKNNLSISNGGIQASTFSSADGGTVTVSAGSIDIGRKGIIVSQASSTGNAGDIDVSSTGHIAITNGGGVSTSTLSSGNAGSIKLSAANIEINGHDRITGIFSITGGDGNAGSVEIHATTGNLSIGHGGSISSNTYASGQAGTVIVDAVGSITIDGQGSSGNDVTIGISSDAKSGSTGNAGNVAVSAKKNLSIVNGGQISSDTLSLGNAGTVKVSAADIAISSGGGISSSTASSGNAGTVTVNANNITIDAFNQGGLPTGIFSESSVTDEGPSGHGGDIAVTADALTLTRGGVISARTSFNGRGGSINLQVNHLALTEGGSITALTSGTGSAGDIIIHSASDVTISGVSATDFRRDYDGQQVTGQFSGIYLNSQGSGNGGNLQLKTRQLTVNDGGLISAIAVDGNVASLPETQAGNIDIDAGSIILANGGAIDASTSGAGRAGSVTVDAGTSITITGKFDHALHPKPAKPEPNRLRFLS